MCKDLSHQIQKSFQIIYGGAVRFLYLPRLLEYFHYKTVEFLDTLTYNTPGGRKDICWN